VATLSTSDFRSGYKRRRYCRSGYCNLQLPDFLLQLSKLAAATPNVGASSAPGFPLQRSKLAAATPNVGAACSTGGQFY